MSTTETKKYKKFKDGTWTGAGEFPEEISETEMDWYTAKAAELATANNVSKVHPVVQLKPETNERVACYIKHPPYIGQIAILDKGSRMGMHMAAEEFRSTYILKEASDALTYGDAPECDMYKMGAAMEAISFITFIRNQYKKK